MSCYVPWVWNRPTLRQRTKWHLITRMIPFVENNYNVCELGPRGTGKSHVYKECSPNSLLVSGGQTTVANLFYNMASRQIGLVGMWDVVAFDEVAGITFKDKDGVQIMKDYMASGSFSRGRDSIEGKASMVFVGNINQSVETLGQNQPSVSPLPCRDDRHGVFRPLPCLYTRLGNPENAPRNSLPTATALSQIISPNTCGKCANAASPTRLISSTNWVITSTNATLSQ